MKTDRFPYEASRWSPAQPDQAKRWSEELETQSPQNVRNRLAQTDAGPAGAVTIGTTEMTIGFAEDWLAWHDRRREASEGKPYRKHWLDWFLGAVTVTSLGIAFFTSVLYQRDDIRVVIGEALKVTRDKGGLVLAQDQDFTFINSGNRQALISEIYAELVLITVPQTGCDGRFAKSIVLNATQIVIKPGDILPVHAKVVQRYPWERDKDGLRFRQAKEELNDSYIVCLQLYVTTPDSSSARLVQPLYLVSPNDDLSKDFFDRNTPLRVIQRTHWGFG
ncbi:hypothetical protein EI171_20970 [Bradyrhizobium sp. LCT2]|uniref:hypothetical protein n=1 Tax=Bradyrhizobium sp. LCT2 TaxID=2493093 RepID=UPI00137433E4|nr:hypothetical protein [Bradyrhizobium sp. LCT2]QHP69541.1 hypothetical protein EI171_20970 [Bradyrhizobium sp. LCT2]